MTRGPLTSELQGAQGSVGLQGEEIKGTVKPSSYDPRREGQEDYSFKGRCHKKTLELEAATYHSASLSLAFL